MSSSLSKCEDWKEEWDRSGESVAIGDATRRGNTSARERGGEKYLVDERRREALGWQEQEEYHASERGREIFDKVARGRETFAWTETRIST